MGIRRQRRGRRGRDITQIASERIAILFDHAGKTARENDIPTSERYVSLARAISMRYNIHLEPRYRRQFCKKCGSYHIPGKNQRVRIHSGRTVRTCLICGDTVRRLNSPRKPQVRVQPKSPAPAREPSGDED
jgi:ribonuclease P protein subunit RPR2